MTAAEQMDCELVLPQATGFHAMKTQAVTASAASVNLNGTWGSWKNRFNNGGGAFVTIYAPSGVDLHVVASATATTAATADTGATVYGGTSHPFWVTSATPFLDIVASGNGTAKLYFSSRNQSSLGEAG